MKPIWDMTKEDYESDPFYRYPSSQKDKMVAYKNQYVISYLIDFRIDLKYLQVHTIIFFFSKKLV